MTCRPRNCGCSFVTSTLNIDQVGNRVAIDLVDAYESAWPGFTFLNAIERDAELPPGTRQEGMEAWLRSTDDKCRFDGTGWKLIRRQPTQFNPTLTNITPGSGATNVMLYSVNEDSVDIQYRLTLGTGGSFGGTNVRISAPIAPLVVVGQRIIVSAAYYDSSANNIISGLAEIATGFTDFFPYRTEGGGTYPVITGQPFTWTNLDELWLWGSYHHALYI